MNWTDKLGVEHKDPKVLMACPTWSGCLYSLPKWAAAYHAQDYPVDRRGALQVDNSDGPAQGGNLHYVHRIRGYDIPAMWQHTRWPALWDTLELSWLMIIEYAHDHDYDYVFSVEADVIVPPEAMRKMVECSLANAKNGKPAIVTQRYHPRGQPGPNFYWDTLGCSLFPVEPLWQDRYLAKAIYETEVFLTSQRHGYPRFRPGHHGPDLFEVEHMKDPNDKLKAIYGGQPAPTAYMKRVLEANGMKYDENGQRIRPVADWAANMIKKEQEEKAKAEEDGMLIRGEAASLTPEETPDIEVSDALIKRPYVYDQNEFTDLISSIGDGLEMQQCPIGTAHLEEEVPPSGANAGQPYAGRRVEEKQPEAEEKQPEADARPIADLMHDEERLKVLAEDRIRLNIGADRQQVSGFLSVDFREEVDPDVLAEATDLSMFEDNTVDEIYASHVLEHLDWNDTMVALKEWMRVLKPGAMLTVATPDITEVYTMYKKGARWGEYGQGVGALYIQATAFGAHLLAEEIPEMRDQYGNKGHKHQSIFFHDMLLNRVIEAGYVYCHEVTECFLRKVGMGETMVQANKPKEGD